MQTEKKTEDKDQFKGFSFFMATDDDGNDLAFHNSNSKLETPE